MLRSGVGRLHRGVATAVSLVSDAPTVYVASYRLLIAANVLASRFHSDSYFSATKPDLLSNPSKSSLSTHILPALKHERFLPPLLDADLFAQNHAQQALFNAIQNLDADRSWHLYKQLGNSRLSMPSSIIDLLLTSQCRKPVRSSPDNIIDSRAAVREVCDRALQLCQDRVHCQVGSSAKASSSAGHMALSTLSKPLSLRLLYLLVVEEEQIAASSSSRPSPRRKHLSSILTILSANLDTRDDSSPQPIDVQLRGRLAGTLSRIGSTNAAYCQLQVLVEKVTPESSDLFIDPRPFDQLLSALARQRTESPRPAEYLPSPVDLASAQIDQNDPILRALRLTLHSQVQASKTNIHKCLQALDSATLWWLLPFELDGKEPNTMQLPDDRYDLKTRWHPWQNSADGLAISQDFLDSFAERVTLVLAQRGILQPALHLFDGLQPTHSDSSQVPYISKRIPDHDLFTVVLEKLAERMASNNFADARKSLDSHRGLSLDLHLAIKIYSIAHSIGVDLDPRLNEAVIKVLAYCLPTAVVDLGPSRAHLTKVKAHIAQRNEQRGSRQALQKYLCQFTNIALARDPDLSKGSLNFVSQATLLGLHMRVRDYTSSKRIYQLLRLRYPLRELWSTDADADSLRRSALHPLASPDHDTFMWLFVESLGPKPKLVFAVRLYLDWLASGNMLSPRLTAMFIQALLRAGLTTVVWRVLEDLHEERISLPSHLARSLVTSFAEAGYPDIAVEMASTVSQVISRTPLVQQGSMGAVGGSFDWVPRLLSPTLSLMSVALDESSRAMSPCDDALRQKVLRLFDEFRLGLTHHLFSMMSRSEPIDGCSAEMQSHVTLQDVRMAYNAIMRVYLVANMNPIDDDPALANPKPSLTIGWNAVKSSCSDVEMLFEELDNLGGNPDNESWTLRLVSCLHACRKAPTSTEQEKWLRRSLQLFEKASGQVFRIDGVLQATWENAPHSTTGSGKQKTTQVRVHPTVVAALIDACCRCSDLKSGLGVYSLHVRQSGFNVNVEKARLMLLAALAKPGQWRKEFDHLMCHNKPAFKQSDLFLKQLQKLSSLTSPRTTSSATD